LVLAIVISLAAGATAGAVLGVWHQDSYWQPRYAQAVSETARWKQSSSKYEDQLTDLEKEVGVSVGNLSNPHFVLWNSCGTGGPSEGCPLTPGYEYVGGVPDTFTYNVSFRSTVPVTVRIITTHDYVCWKSGGCDAHWYWWQDRMSLDDVFHDAEGCAGYLAVFTSKETGTLYPDVSITRNPASVSTGACA
jgi:hypothetical protein